VRRYWPGSSKRSWNYRESDGGMDMPGRDKAEAYRIGIYVRESRDDHEENYETIETQRDLLIDFVGRNHLGTVCRVYTDDNVSGSGFERRGIEQMKSDVAAGYINLLVLKDLSRLGRNSAKTFCFWIFWRNTASVS
jgi:site-specific DNA recombinase